jgi:ankyrin repeat protein
MDTGAAVTVEALTTAAQQGDAARLQQLLAQDANALSAIGPGGWTPLHLAVYFGHADAAEVLLAQGADVHAWSENESRNQPLHAATAGSPKDGIPALAALLISYGADVNARQHGGWTPLHAAADDGPLTLITLLLDAGADVTAANDYGQTALDLARKNGRTDAAALLTARGAE